MVMKLLVAILLISTLQAKSYSEPFVNLSKPLFEFAAQDQTYLADPDLPRLLKKYKTEAEAAKQISKGELNEKERAEYLKKLRALQKSHNRILALLKSKILDSIDQNSYQKFEELLQREPKELLKNRSFKAKVLSFYRKNQKKINIPYLHKSFKKVKKSTSKTTRASAQNRVDTDSSGDGSSYREWMRAMDRSKNISTTPYRYVSKGGSGSATNKNSNSQQRYSKKKVIVLTTKTCGACYMAKDALRKKKIPFVEYDVDSSPDGKRLFKKHKGYAVPLIIVGDKSMAGYEEGAFMRLYN